MYASFAMVFPKESGCHPLTFQLKSHNAFGLPGGHYELHDIYPTRQEPPIYEVFLNLGNSHNEIVATLYCQLDAEEQQLQLSLSETHLQTAQAQELLSAVDYFFQQQEGQSWADILVNRAAQMQSAEAHNTVLKTQETRSEDTPPLLKEEILRTVFAQAQNLETQGAIIDSLLAEIRQQMLQELETYRAKQAQHSKIIRFPIERCQPEVEIHWLDLRLELMDLPHIWRRIRVPDNLNLSQLHLVLQLSMGWKNKHIWRFIHSRGEYVSYEAIEHIWEDELNADKTPLADLLIRRGSRLDYEYDFGDSWYHILKVEQRHKPNRLNQRHLQCLEGSGACPPEDSGGYFGYQELSKLIQKKRPSKNDKDKLIKLGSYDLTAFSCEAINLQLQKAHHQFNFFNF